MATPRERVPLGATPWSCDPNAILCQDGDHLLAFYKTGYRADWRRISGHTFLQCVECDPPTFFCAVFGKVDGMATVTCYPIDKASFDEWDKGDEPTPPTPELLYRLRDPSGRRHNPHWQPPRNRR